MISKVYLTKSLINGLDYAVKAMSKHILTKQKNGNVFVLLLYD